MYVADVQVLAGDSLGNLVGKTIGAQNRQIGNLVTIHTAFQVDRCIESVASYTYSSVVTATNQ